MRGLGYAGDGRADEGFVVVVEWRRGWSAVHFREGDDKQCTGGVIRNNEIVSIPCISSIA